METRFGPQHPRIGQDLLMRLDHVSNETFHDQLADKFQQLGSCLGSTFVVGGIHQRFGTRNLTLLLQSGHYLEVACPLDHPASDLSLFSRAISKRATEGGGWLTWVASVDDATTAESRLGRQAVDCLGTKPEGQDPSWTQIGVLSTLDDKQLPYFVELKSLNHPSIDDEAIEKIVKVESAGDEREALIG